MKNIVIIDDKQANLDAALKAFPGAMTFTEAEKAIDYITRTKDQITAILTDLVVPVTSYVDWDRNFLTPVDGKPLCDILPMGILVCFAAAKRSIPVAVVTGGHGNTPMEHFFAYQFCKNFGIPCIGDSLDQSKVKKTSKWQEAFTKLNIPVGN